jgi:hypothetical protein
VDYDLNALHAGYQQSLQQQAAAPAKPKKKGNILINNLPALFSGLGAVGGSFLAPAAGTIGGGAAGGALGESLKRALLGEKQDLGQSVIQGVEGGALAAFQPIKAAKAASAATKGFVSAGADTAAKTAAKPTLAAAVSKNLITQGQAAQGRVAGVSAGTKIAGKDLTPQDTATMLKTLKAEGIKQGNANNALRDVQDKLTQYGKQISSHFTANNAPLKATEVNQIAKGFTQSLGTTDPRILSEAKILVGDLKKNVTDTKSLWQFRKSLDTRIPDAKLAAGDNVLTNKLTAVKGLRQYIAQQLGDIPGAKNYHALAEIKPFVSAEAKRLNNPGGGIVGRLAASGPVQKVEALAGQAAEGAGNRLSGTPSLTDALQQATPKSFGQTAKDVATLPLRSAAAPIAYPGKSALQVGKQVVGRGAGNLAVGMGQPQDTAAAPSADSLQPLEDPSQNQQSANPYPQESLLADIQRDPANQDKYIKLYQTYAKLFPDPATAGGDMTAAQQTRAAAAQNALQDIPLLQDAISSGKLGGVKALPGSGTAIGRRLLGTEDLDAALFNIADNILRARSGAAAPEAEVKRFKDTFLPGPLDSEEAKKLKLERAVRELQGYVNPGGAAGGSNLTLQDALMQLQQ